MRAASEAAAGVRIGDRKPRASRRWGLAFLLGVLVLGLSTGSLQAISNPLLIGNNQNKTTGTQIIVTSSAAVQVGSTVIVTFTMFGSSAALGATPCIDSVGNTYSTDVDTGQVGMRTIIFSTTVTNALTNTSTITVTHPSVQRKLVAAFSVTGIAATRFDKSQNNTSTGTSATSLATATTAQANELLIGSFGMENGSVTFTPTGSFTTLGTVSTGGGGSEISHGSAYRTVSATGAYAATATVPNNAWAAAIATYKEGPCGNGSLDGAEQCDQGVQNGTAGSCCTATCTFVTIGTVCQASAGVCDLAESCTGSSAACPADVANLTSVCRASAGSCDVAESCSVASYNCDDY